VAQIWALHRVGHCHDCRAFHALPWESRAGS
jgi:hypothetical protein